MLYPQKYNRQFPCKYQEITCPKGKNLTVLKPAWGGGGGGIVCCETGLCCLSSHMTKYQSGSETLIYVCGRRHCQMESLNSPDRL
jgi:hypothetical protein